MTYVISDACVSCDSCAAECPVSAIPEGDSQYVIDAGTYTDYGTYATTCPAGVISEDQLSIT